MVFISSCDDDGQFILVVTITVSSLSLCVGHFNAGFSWSSGIYLLNYVDELRAAVLQTEARADRAGLCLWFNLQLDYRSVDEQMFTLRSSHSADLFPSGRSGAPGSAESPPDGLFQCLVPQAVDDGVQEGSQGRVQHRHDDTHLRQNNTACR